VEHDLITAMQCQGYDREGFTSVVESLASVQLDSLITNRVAKPLKGRTAVKRSYDTIDKQGKANEKNLAEFLSKAGNGH
jgi:hypothetical protein